MNGEILNDQLPTLVIDTKLLNELSSYGRVHFHHRN